MPEQWVAQSPPEGSHHDLLEVGETLAAAECGCQLLDGPAGLRAQILLDVKEINASLVRVGVEDVKHSITYGELVGW